MAFCLKPIRAPSKVLSTDQQNPESLRAIPFDDVMDDDTDQSQWGRVCGSVIMWFRGFVGTLENGF